MYRVLIITRRVSLLKKKRKEKLEVFSFFHANKNELMDMEALFFVFCKEFAGINRILFVFGEKNPCVPHFIFCIISSHFVIFLMQFP